MKRASKFYQGGLEKKNCNDEARLRKLELSFDKCFSQTAPLHNLFSVVLN